MNEGPEQGGARGGMTVAEIADLVDGRLEGDPDVTVHGLRPLEEAGPRELGLLSSKRYARFASRSHAGAVLVSRELAGSVPEGATRVVVEDAGAVVPLVLERLHPKPSPPRPGVHPTAVLSADIRLGASVTVGPYAVLGEAVRVGEGTRIDAHVVLGAGSVVGKGCHIHPQVVVYPGARIGDRVVLHSGARVGSDGFGYTFRDGEHRKVPQVGGCVIGDDVEIGANTTIDRGSIGDTVLGPGVKVDNLVQVAHNVRVGPHSLVAALVGVAGSTRIGSGVWLGGQSGLIGHLDIGDGARIAVATKVLRDVPAGETVSGHPARPHREELRRQAHLGRLPKLLERLEALEEQVRQLGGDALDGAIEPAGKGNAGADEPA